MGKHTASPPSDALDILVGTEVTQGLLGLHVFPRYYGRVLQLVHAGISCNGARAFAPWPIITLAKAFTNLPAFGNKAKHKSGLPMAH